jgi:hypothetical protein
LVKKWRKNNLFFNYLENSLEQDLNDVKNLK